MSSRIPPDFMPNQITKPDVRQLYEGVARASFVKSVREFEVWDRDVIIAFDVETYFGRTNVLAVSTPADVEDLIGSLHIRTKLPTVPTPTDGELVRLQELAVFMHYVRAEGEIGIEAQSRLPIMRSRAVFDVFVPWVEHIIRLQGSILVGTFRERLRAQHVVWSMAPYRPSREQLRVVCKELRDAIDGLGFRVVELDSGCVVLDRGSKVPAASAYRVEVSIENFHWLFGSLACIELVVPWAHGRAIDSHEAAVRLNRGEQALEDATLGVGAWYAHLDDDSLRYRILLPFTEQWSPELDLIVGSLVRRWMSIKERNLKVPSDFGMADTLGSLFASTRSSQARVIRADQFDNQISLEEYCRDAKARERVAQLAGVSVRSINRYYLGSPPRRPREGGGRQTKR